MTEPEQNNSDIPDKSSENKNVENSHTTEVEKNETSEKKLFSNQTQVCPIERCVIDEKIFEGMKEFLKSRKEHGGFLIGEYSDEKTAIIHAAVFPPQTNHSAIYCEFDTRSMIPIIFYLNEVGLENFGTVSWVHSHPMIGFFLSGTDKNTFRFLIRQNPKLVAMVVDPYSPEEAVVFANKNEEFEISRIPLDIQSVDMDYDKVVLLNFMKEIVPDSTVITYQKPNTPLANLLNKLNLSKTEMKTEIINLKRTKIEKENKILELNRTKADMYEIIDSLKKSKEELMKKVKELENQIETKIENIQKKKSTED